MGSQPEITDRAALPRSTPAEQGVDPRGIDAFLDALAPLAEVEPHSLMVLRHGHVVAERWWRPYAPATPHHLYSLSKSFTSTALGFAVDEGLVELDAPVLSYFPELDAEVTDEGSRSMLVRHVASMASGHETDIVEQAYRAGAGDMLRGLLLIPPDREPGTVFTYNQPCTYAVSAIVRRVSGGTLTEFLRPRLYEPLGIASYGWRTDGLGRELGYAGLHVPTEAIANLGQLYLDRGEWAGRRLLSEDWVAEATRTQIATHEPNPDWRAGYGFQFWRARHGYRGDGAYGQFMVILPEADAVVAMTSQSPDMQAQLDALWTHLLPALTAGDGPPGVWPAAAPELTRPAGPPADLTPATFRPGAVNEVTALREVRLTGGAVVLSDDGPDLVAELGAAGTWTVTGAVATAHAAATAAPANATANAAEPAATANAANGARVCIDLIFTETPHRLRLALDTAAGTFEARWQSSPLGHVSLAALRSPR